MKIQVLVATMHQKDYGLLSKMNIQSDAIIANQCDRNEIEEFMFMENKIKYLSFAERGVGLNRNNALMRADADVCLLADDDMIYINDYPSIVERYFNDNPDADVIIFNLIENPQKRYITKKTTRIRFYNFMKFGAARIAFRKNSVTKHGICFNLHFGGGAEYSAGEDTLFLHSCLKHGLKIISVPCFIAELTDTRDSTWFRGYTKKYFHDKGALFACISKRWSKILCLQFCIRYKKFFEKDITLKEAFKIMIEGTKEI